MSYGRAKCEHCGSPLPIGESKGRPRRFCDRSCRMKRERLFGKRSQPPLKGRVFWSCVCCRAEFSSAKLGQAASIHRLHLQRTDCGSNQRERAFLDAIYERYPSCRFGEDEWFWVLNADQVIHEEMLDEMYLKKYRSDVQPRVQNRKSGLNLAEAG